MNKMDHDGLIMCRMQGRMFELSLNEEGSSAVFIRRFMNSSLAKRMDRLAFLNTAQSELQALAEIKEEYHKGSTEAKNTIKKNYTGPVIFIAIGHIFMA